MLLSECHNEDLIDATEALVHDSDRRQKLSRIGFDAFSQRRAGSILREALLWSNTVRLPGDAVIGSGKMYDPKPLNIDIDARRHPDIVADIADPELFEREFVSAVSVSFGSSVAGWTVS